MSSHEAARVSGDDANKVPDWHTEPFNLYMIPGMPIKQVTVKHAPELVIALPPVLQELRAEVARIAFEKDMHDGPLASVVNIESSRGGRTKLTTAAISWFDYVAAASYYGGRYPYSHDENPILPLAVQTAFITPEANLIVDKRPGSMTDWPNAIGLFGGSAGPDDINLHHALLEKLNLKLGLTLHPSQVFLTGYGKEKINNIICVFYAVDLNHAQTRTLLRDGPNGRRQLYSPQSLFDSFPIDRYDPNAFMDLMCALAACRIRNLQEVIHLIVRGANYLTAHPIQYNHPLQVSSTDHPAQNNFQP